MQKQKCVKKRSFDRIALIVLLSCMIVLASGTLVWQLFFKGQGAGEQEVSGKSGVSRKSDDSKKSDKLKESDDSKKSDELEAPRLYDQHNKFIETVKKNLEVPDLDGITYVMGEPVSQFMSDTETVYIQFVIDGKTVAAAECYAENGDLARSIVKYNPELLKEEPDVVRYQTYTNGRYGFSVLYPDILLPQPGPTNGDGRTFVSSDGRATMTVWGSHSPAANLSNLTLEEYYDFTLNNLGYEPTYKTMGDNFFVFSGYKGDNIIYQRHILKSDGTENVLKLEYPAEKKERFDEIATYASMNMKTGIGADSGVSK